MLVLTVLLVCICRECDCDSRQVSLAQATVNSDSDTTTLYSNGNIFNLYQNAFLRIFKPDNLVKNKFNIDFKSVICEKMVLLLWLTKFHTFYKSGEEMVTQYTRPSVGKHPFQQIISCLPSDLVLTCLSCLFS